MMVGMSSAEWELTVSRMGTTMTSDAADEAAGQDGIGHAGFQIEQGLPPGG